MLIRHETCKDYDKVYELVKSAFETAEHSDGTEHDLVKSLRKSNAFVKELSLVAEINGEIAGYIMFTEGKVGNDVVLILAPLSVSPKFKKQGVGTALIEEGHKIAKEMGYLYALVLGSEKYYPRVGYLPAEQLGIEAPEGIPSENFMAIQLAECADSICGSVVYAEEFGM